MANQSSGNQVTKKQIAVLISGTGSNLKAIINASLNNEINADVALVISNNPDAFGINHAKDHNIPFNDGTRSDDRLNSDDII